MEHKKKVFFQRPPEKNPDESFYDYKSRLWKNRDIYYPLPKKVTEKDYYSNKEISPREQKNNQVVSLFFRLEYAKRHAFLNFSKEYNRSKYCFDLLFENLKKTNISYYRIYNQEILDLLSEIDIEQNESICFCDFENKICINIPKDKLEIYNEYRKVSNDLIRLYRIPEIDFFYESDISRIIINYRKCPNIYDVIGLVFPLPSSSLRLRRKSSAKRIRKDSGCKLNIDLDMPLPDINEIIGSIISEVEQYNSCIYQNRNQVENKLKIPNYKGNSFIWRLIGLWLWDKSHDNDRYNSNYPVEKKFKSKSRQSLFEEWANKYIGEGKRIYENYNYAYKKTSSAIADLDLYEIHQSLIEISSIYS